MNPTFTISHAHGPHGEKPNEASPEDYGLFQFDLDGSRFSMLSLADCQVTMAYLQGGVDQFEPFSLRIWSSLAKTSDLVLDIGAYTGIYSLVTFAANPRAIVVAFEASKTTFGRLMTNILINGADGRIAPVHMAASNRSGHLDLALSGGIYTMASGESLEPKPSSSIWSRQRVPTISVDEIIIDWRHFHPSDLTLQLPTCGVSLVKIDVEGHEKSTLAGMRRIVERDHPTMLVEVLKPDDLPEILNTLSGYEGFWISEQGSISREHRGEGWNALLIHETRKDDVRRQVREATGAKLPV